MRRYIIILILLGLNNIASSQIREEPIMLRTKDCDIQGTLTLPAGETHMVVLIVPGAGPTDRDCNNSVFLRTNAYRQYALALAQNNIASVRYDKRGVGASRIRDYDPNKMRFSMYVDDVKEWVHKLYWQFPIVVVAGHSEGSLQGMAAIKEGIPASGFISISGMGRRFDKVLKDQITSRWPQLHDAASVIIDSLSIGRKVDNVPFFLRNHLHPSSQPFIISKISYDPLSLIGKIKVPILVVQGDTDIQVSLDDASSLCAANRKAKLIIVEGMNHVMKDCPTLDRIVQDDTYVNPTYPLNSKFIFESVKFIQGLK